MSKSNIKPSKSERKAIKSGRRELKTSPEYQTSKRELSSIQYSVNRGR